MVISCRYFFIVADNGAATAAAAAANALQAQTRRRAARQAERERGICERARAAATSLETGEWKASASAFDSAAFARSYKISMAKKARRSYVFIVYWFVAVIIAVFSD